MTVDDRQATSGSVAPGPPPEPTPGAAACVPDEDARVTGARRLAAMAQGTRLARMQAAIVLGVAAAALAAAAVARALGHNGWAIVALGFVPALHAVLMAIEFGWARRANREDPAGAPDRRQTLAAWWAELTHAICVFGLWQPFLSRRIGDHLPPDAVGRPGVLLVHGFVCNRGLWRTWLPRLSARGIPCVAVDLEPVFGRIEDYADRIDAGVRALEAATGRPPVVVAHSMGGLAVRHWWAGQAAARLHHLITIGSPHHGTRLARLAHAPNARQMREGSAWTSSLLDRQPPAQLAQTTCYFAHADNIVFPASAATLPGADNRHLGAVGHIGMVERTEPFAALLALLDEADAPGGHRP